jgi:hypothetical protein
MPTSVLIYSPTFSLSHSIRREIITNNYGDGYYQSITSEAAYSRADGTGISSAHKGLHIFDINFSNVNKTRANEIWTFFLARLNLINEPFYFYNPEENLIPDPTGASAVGRYLVRFASPDQVLSREYLRNCIWGYSTLQLIECRS